MPPISRECPSYGGVVLRLHQQGEVQLAAPQASGQPAAGVGEHLQLQRRQFRAEARQETAEQLAGVFLGNAEAHPQRLFPSAQPGEHAVVGLQQLCSLALEPLPQRGQPHRLVVALEQPAAGQFLQAPDVGAHRRGAAVEVAGRGEKAAEAQDGMEGTQQLDIQVGAHGSDFLHDWCR